jgi:hypothetical protein
MDSEMMRLGLFRRKSPIADAVFARRSAGTRYGTWKKMLTLITPTRRWTQFRLVTMLLLVSILCVWLAIAVHRANKQREAVAAIGWIGGIVAYHGDPEPGANPSNPGEARESASAYLCNVFGKDLLRSVRSVSFLEGKVTE